MTRTPVAIVPLKRLRDAKLRLAHVLSPAARAVLARALFDHVTRVLAGAGLRTIALAPDGAASLGALPPGVVAWRDEVHGLNGALRAALGRVQGPVLVVPADLPWLTSADVRLLLREPGDVVVCRSTDGGTNGLLLRARLAPAFGPASALAHAEAGRREGLRARVVRIEGFEHDVDDEWSLRAALAGAAPGISPAIRDRLKMDAGARGSRAPA